MVVWIFMRVFLAISLFIHAFGSIHTDSTIVTFPSCDRLVMEVPASQERKNRAFSIRTRSSEIAFRFPLASSFPM